MQKERKLNRALLICHIFNTLPADSNTHYTANLYLGASGASSNATSAVSNPYLVLRENSTTRNNIQLKAGTGMSVSGVSGVVTIGHSNSITAGTASGSAGGAYRTAHPLRPALRPYGLPHRKRADPAGHTPARRLAGRFDAAGLHGF